MKKFIIAIDGYASTGKSSLAKQLSLHLNYVYVNSGSMYRAITFFALKNGLTPLNKENIDRLINLLPEIKLDYRTNNVTGISEIHLNNKNIEGEILSTRNQLNELKSKIQSAPRIIEEENYCFKKNYDG